VFEKLQHVAIDAQRDLFFRVRGTQAAIKDFDARPGRGIERSGQPVWP